MKDKTVLPPRPCKWIRPALWRSRELVLPQETQLQQCCLATSDFRAAFQRLQEISVR